MVQHFVSLILLVFCLTLTSFGQTSAKLLQELIDLPSPPPPMKEEQIDRSGQITKKPRSREFYDSKNIPTDDAPIEDLFDFWVNQESQNKQIKVSHKSAIRILNYLENEPNSLRRFLSLFPNDFELAAKIKQIFDSAKNNTELDDYWKDGVKDWLKLNSSFYLEELIADAKKAKDHPKYFSVDKETELKALSKIDWEKAKPILQQLENDKSNPRTATLAMRLFYEHFIAIKDKTDEEIYHEKLKKILVNQKSTARARNIAASALFNSDWEGQDEFYLSLMSDKTLLFLTEKQELFSPLMTLPRRNPDKWIPILAKLVGNKNRAIHNVAVQNLVDFRGRKDALEPLLPWLSNPKWADITWSPGGRTTYMQIVDEVDLPESVPGLIWIIENEDYEARWAVDSLAHYKDSRAIPALKARLAKDKEGDERNLYINALLKCGGLSIDEQLNAILQYVEKISTSEGFKEVEETYYYNQKIPFSVEISIGKFISNKTKVDDELFLKLIDKEKILQKEKPNVAKTISSILAKWQGRAVNLQLIERVNKGNADVETILGMLARRKELRENVLDEINSMQTKSGLSEGIASCLLEDEKEVFKSFKSDNLDTKISALACARLIRLQLPVSEVTKSLNDSNQLLALASERYLESEDSKEAQQLVLSKHPNEALILGARTSFNSTRAENSSPNLEMLFSTIDNLYRIRLSPYESSYPELDEFEDKLRDELKSNSDLVEIFALVPKYVVRIYKDKATMIWYENDARYRETILTNEQVKGLKDYWANNNFEELPPLFGYCHHNCASVNFIRVDKNGGRRFFAYTNIGSLETIFANFQSLDKDENTKTHYYSQNNIKDLQLLYADDRFSVKAIWKNGNDFRVLVEDIVKQGQISEELYKQNIEDSDNDNLDWEQKDKLKEKRRAKREFEHFEWRKFENGKLGEAVKQPDEVPFLRNEKDVPYENLSEYRTENEVWKVKGGDYEVYAGYNEKKGIWKVNRNDHKETKLNNGWYADAIITPDGKWAVAPKTDTDWGKPNYIVRVNVETGKEDKVNIKPAGNLYPVVFVPEHNKVLIYSADEEGFMSPTAKFYLLDVEKNVAQDVKGEFLPLKQQTFRPLQKTNNPDEYWAAIPDGDKKETQIGRYNAKIFSFESVMTVPNILFNSMTMWIDEKEGKVYLIYGDYQSYQMLSLPFLK